MSAPARPAAEAETPPAPDLAAVRARIDAVDAGLLGLLEERMALADAVAAAKQAAGETGFGLRPARELEILRALFARVRHCPPALTERVWRELMGASLSRQGPFRITVWPGAEPMQAARVGAAARQRFGGVAPLGWSDRPLDAVAAARAPWGVAVLALSPGEPWWGRLLAEPRMRVFAALNADPAGAESRPDALAAAELAPEPTGGDETFWVTDAPRPATIEEALSRDGVAARLLCEGGGLRLFGLMGFYQEDDARLQRAPGSLKGVIGAAPAALL